MVFESQTASSYPPKLGVEPAATFYTAQIGMSPCLFQVSLANIFKN